MPTASVLTPADSEPAAYLAAIAAILVCLPCQAANVPVPVASDRATVTRAASDRFVDSVADNVWNLTREADWVAAVDVVSVDKDIAVEVRDILKGQAGAAKLTFPAPPRRLPDQKGICCPPPPGWSFVAGEKWVIFLKRGEAGYTFIGGRNASLDASLVSVQQFMEFEALTNDEDRARLLVRFIKEREGMSSFPALLTLRTLNRPELLDLLAPLAAGNACKQAYISLLSDNTSPKALDLLRAMLHTENGDFLRQTIDALGRKSEENEDISKEFLPFLCHSNSAVRSTSVFILSYRRYHNAFPQIVKALDDPEPKVRTSALAWPWYAYVNEHPEAKAKIQMLRSDGDAQVREAAKRALAGISPWYRIWCYHR